jgi:hypothetical protein
VGVVGGRCVWGPSYRPYPGPSRQGSCGAGTAEATAERPATATTSERPTTGRQPGKPWQNQPRPRSMGFRPKRPSPSSQFWPAGAPSIVAEAAPAALDRKTPWDDRRTAHDGDHQRRIGWPFLLPR